MATESTMPPTGGQREHEDRRGVYWDSGAVVKETELSGWHDILAVEAVVPLPTKQGLASLTSMADTLLADHGFMQRRTGMAERFEE